jgi:hypothetical protein
MKNMIKGIIHADYFTALHDSILRLYIMLLNFDFKADPDPAFFTLMWIPIQLPKIMHCRSRYATLPRAVREGTVSQVARKG